MLQFTHTTPTSLLCGVCWCFSLHIPRQSPSCVEFADASLYTYHANLPLVWSLLTLQFTHTTPASLLCGVCWCFSLHIPRQPPSCVEFVDASFYTYHANLPLVWSLLMLQFTHTTPVSLLCGVCWCFNLHILRQPPSCVKFADASVYTYHASLPLVWNLLMLQFTHESRRWVFYKSYVLSVEVYICYSINHVE